MDPSKIEWYSRIEENVENPIRINISEFENGVIVVISDAGAKLGTIGIGVPTVVAMNRISTSSMPLVFGIKNDLLTRAIAERVAQRCKKIVIASTHLSNESPELAERAIKFMEEITKEFFSR